MKQHTADEKNTGLLFYHSIMALDPSRHAGFKLGQAPNYRFAADTSSVPLAGVEFAETAKEYPIVFAQAGENDFTPVAIFGWEDNENLFLDAKAAWQARYLPAFVRRYPFILAENPDNPSQPWVCVDEACSWLGRTSGQLLFVGNQPSGFMTQILDFLADYNTQMQRTVAFCRKLQDWGLLRENPIQATAANGRSYALDGFWVIDEAVLNRLEADKVQAFFSTGELAWMYFHLASLSNFRWLAERKAARPVMARATPKNPVKSKKR